MFLDQAKALALKKDLELDIVDELNTDIGKIYLDLEDYDQAERLLKLAINSYKSRYDEEHHSLGTPYRLIARLNRSKGNYEKAIDIIEDRISI